MTAALPSDIRDFLADYPRNDVDDESASANLEFYLNKRRCQPDNVLIDEIHERWSGNYTKLEYKHGFIQWLFPIQEYGVNYEAQPLQKHEREIMRGDQEITNRVLKSYRLMLDFYGMQLKSTETGLLARVEPERKCSDRYRNLVRAYRIPFSAGALNDREYRPSLLGSQHNYLRISRILKCLSEMGLERLNAGFLLHLLNEQSEHDELNTTAIRSSMDGWWANCIRNEEERAWIRTLTEQVRQGEVTFKKEMYEEALQRRKKTGSFLDRAEDDNEKVEERKGNEEGV